MLRQVTPSPHTEPKSINRFNFISPAAPAQPKTWNPCASLLDTQIRPAANVSPARHVITSQDPTKLQSASSTDDSLNICLSGMKNSSISLQSASNSGSGNNTCGYTEGSYDNDDVRTSALSNRRRGLGEIEIDASSDPSTKNSPNNAELVKPIDAAKHHHQTLAHSATTGSR
jgi:hypothetical protein